MSNVFPDFLTFPEPVKMNKRIIIIVVFSIGLAFIEAVVVVYLRTIFYPEGFVFPLVGFTSDKRWL